MQQGVGRCHPESVRHHSLQSILSQLGATLPPCGHSLIPGDGFDCLSFGVGHGGRVLLASAGGSAVKNPPKIQELQETQLIDPWVRKIPWRAWQPTPVFLLGNLMDRGTWWATVHRITKSRTRLKGLSLTYERITDLSFFYLVQTRSACRTTGQWIWEMRCWGKGYDFIQKVRWQRRWQTNVS